jgi:hypothetical protein
MDALAVPPRDEVRAAVDAVAAAPDGERDALAAAAGDLVDRWVRQFAGYVDGFAAFVAVIQEWLLAEHGLGALTTAERLDRWVVHAMAIAPTEAELADLDRRPGAEVAGILRSGGADAASHAMAVWGDVESAWRKSHDIHVDLVAVWLSQVYRGYGVDALEACLRHSGDRTLVAWMPIDRARPVEQRVRQWARLLRGNFSNIRVDEDDDGFTFTQDPCGTCARQITRGAYAPPLDAAVVSEAHPITFGLGGVPVYRTHVPLFHRMIPMERAGEEWPEIRCPVGMGTGPCTVRLTKAPPPG